jgi:hypothetical protein
MNLEDLIKQAREYDELDMPFSSAIFWQKAVEQKMKKYILITSLFIMALNLNAQRKLYFVKDIIPKYGKKTRVFRTDTLDFAACEAVIKTDSIKLNKIDSLDAFYIQYYIRNNTNVPIILTRFTTNAGSNVPRFDGNFRILEPHKIGCYIICQYNYTLDPKQLSGSITWEYVDKKTKEKKERNILLLYRFQFFE